MSVEIKPIGDRCNLNCAYCYEHPIREAGEPPVINVKAIKEALLKANSEFTVFGGEPLLVPRKLLEELFQFGFEHWKKNSIQTNALLIDLELIKLFKKYNVHIGISFDGPDELNNARCPLQITKKIESNIDLLMAMDIIPSFIVTLTKYNAGDNVKLSKLIEWFKYLDSRGVRSTRLHNLEYTDKCASIALSDDEQYEAFVKIFEETRTLKNLRFDVFDDIRRALRGDFKTLTCIWNGCDPYNTRAVFGIKADGEVENCGRIYKDGTIWLKSSGYDDVRTRMLESTPYDEGGCKDCRFFPICKGQCPGTAIDGDWRNRTKDCKFWTRLFEYFETPESITQKPKEICCSDNSHSDIPHGDYYGDHTDSSLIIVPVMKK